MADAVLLAYAAAAIEHGWSRDILEIQIETGYLKRLGKSVNNFHRTLPKPQSDLANQTLKGPYLFDFVELSGHVDERRLERALVERIRSFLLELGVGFAFVGNQVHMEVEGEDFCKSKKRVIVEYTLREGKRPIGVANYQLTRALPEGLAKNLPTVDELEAELSQNTIRIDEGEDAEESPTP